MKEMKEIKKFSDFPLIFVKKRGSKYIKEYDIRTFVEHYENNKESVLGAFKPKLPFFPKRWQDYNFFKEEYKRVPADEEQKKRLKKIKANFDKNISFFEAKRLIKQIEKELPPTPAAEKALSNYGVDPKKFTRETAKKFLELKEIEEEENKKIEFKNKLEKNGIQITGDISQLELEDFELFEDYSKELRNLGLKYESPKTFSIETFKKEISLLDGYICFLDEIPDYIKDLKESKEISRKLKKNEMKKLFPDFINLLRKKEQYFHEDILNLIRKNFPDVIL